MDLREESVRNALIQDLKGQFEGFLTLYEQNIYGFVYSHVTWSSCASEVAQELTQDTFLKVFRWMKRYPERIPTANFRGLLIETAKKLTIDYYNQSHPDKETAGDLQIVTYPEDVDALVDTSNLSPEAACEEKEQYKEYTERIEHLLSILSEEDQRLIRLRHGEGQTYNAIATMTGLPREYIRARVQNAMRRLQRRAANVIPQ